MSDLTVAILDCNFPSTDLERSIVQSAGAGFVLGNCRTEEEVVAFAAAADACIVQYAPLTRRVLTQLQRCRVVARYGIGVDSIDVPAATDEGIWVTNVPGFCKIELAEHTMAMVLGFARRLNRLDRSVHRGEWETIGVMRPTRRLSELTLGLVGFGQVGREVASRARAFGLRVIATAPRTDAATMASYNVEKVSLEELLRAADFVSLHLPLTAESRHLLDAERLALLKPSAYLINTSRGPIVDEAALIAALQAGRLAGAGLDVLEREPPASDNPLLGMENVVITPHAAYYSDDALEFLQTSVAEEVVRVLRGDRPRSPVNPDVVPRRW
ncbi:MAG TPA: C-terminal binding protein [Chloroflexota bacterium]|nr:C-terminal binding protein [Chloroflexota bacterium]